jgi:hypothetical protein
LLSSMLLSALVSNSNVEFYIDGCADNFMNLKSVKIINQ